jgi:hypothetical protein
MSVYFEDGAKLATTTITVPGTGAPITASKKERNRIYRILRLEITPQEYGILDVRSILSDGLRAPHENSNVADDFVLAERLLSLGRPLVRSGSRAYEIGAM